jgi:hypothetical protein
MISSIILAETMGATMIGINHFHWSPLRQLLVTVGLGGDDDIGRSQWQVTYTSVVDV